MCAQARVAGRYGERQSTAIAAIMRGPPSDSLHGVTEGAQVKQVGIEPEGEAVSLLVMAGQRSRAIS